MGYPEYPHDTIYPQKKMLLYHLKRKIELRIEHIKADSPNRSLEVSELEWVVAEIDKIL